MPELQNLFVVTGTSRGLGAAISEQLLAPAHHVLTIARRANPALRSRAEATGVRCEQWTLDLAEPVGVAAKLQAWLEALPADGYAAATLINNAASMPRIGPIDDGSDADLATSLRVNLEAPLLLSAAFLRATRTWPIDKRVLNISSGLARRAMAGQAPYCAAKAGMDHMTRAMALDEALRPHGARLVSLAPGVVDTEMQLHLRAGDPAAFPDRDNFVKMKENGQLTSADAAAARVLAYLARDDFGAQAVADVRET